MEKSKHFFISLSLAAMLTVGYCAFVFYTFHLFSSFIVSKEIALPFLSRATTQHLLLWQGLAVVSFLVNVVWRKKRNRSSDLPFLVCSDSCRRDDAAVFCAGFCHPIILFFGCNALETEIARLLIAEL